MIWTYKGPKRTLGITLPIPLGNHETRSGNRVKGRGSISLQASLGFCKSSCALVGLPALAEPRDPVPGNMTLSRVQQTV